MVGILILTHGGMADELLSAARRITGDLEGFAALSLDWDDAIEEADRKVRAAITSVEKGEGVLVLVDIFGGTPCNLAMQHRVEGHVEVVAGVNLPMVVRLGCMLSSQDEPMPLPELTEWIRSKGRASICSSPTVDARSMRKVGC